MVSRGFCSFIFLLSLFTLSATLPCASGAAPKKHAYNYKKYDPLYGFAKKYAAALSSCDREEIASLYAEKYTAYETDGEIYGKAGLVRSLGPFCSNYANSTFEITHYHKTSRTQFYLVMKMKYSGFKTGHLIYSHSFTVRRRRFRFGKLKITRDLKGINGERIKAALGKKKPAPVKQNI